jgi:hypothetical protein
MSREKLRNNRGADAPPSSAAASSTSMNFRARLVSVNRDSQAPTPRAKIYSDDEENW